MVENKYNCFMNKICLHNLQYACGSVHSKTRVGRGHGAGKGETAGKGKNGNQQRSGFKYKWGFEGGQTPLYKRLPIVHHINNFSDKSVTVTTDMLKILFSMGIKIITKDVLVEYRIIKKNDRYKIVSGSYSPFWDGVEIYADGFSTSVSDNISSNGGKCFIKKTKKSKLS